MRGRWTCTLSLLILLAATVSWASAQPNTSPPAQQSRTLVVDALGKGTVDVTGLWQFHTGDDPAWSKPGYDDSAWENLTADAPWGAQGHPSYAGFAWYRRHIEIHPSPGMNDSFMLLIPSVEDSYEVFWNGQSIGRYGRFPPHASWDYSTFPKSFPLRGSNSGVLAIRVWKSPLDIFSVAESGGLMVPPAIGEPDTIALYEQEITWDNVRSDLFDYSLILLRVFIALLSVILWTRDRREGLFLWVGVFTVAPVGLGILQNLFFIPFSYGLARLINQPLYAISNISLWFLLVCLLKLDQRRRLSGITRFLAFLTLGASLYDGILAYFWGSATVSMQWADGILCAVILLTELFPFVLIVIGLKSDLELSREVVAVAALISETFQTLGDLSALGRRFTHFTLYDELIDNHQLQIQGVVFTPQKISSLVLFATILYAVYRYIVSQQARRAVLEREIQSAREIQRVLIPETLPRLDGYAITSAYTPAQEVGGDFFQIIATTNGSGIVAIGDVSGKGLKAAMNVSMILGVIRSQAATTTSPSEILNALNNCLTGSMDGGFATGIVLRLDIDGTATFANAGHLPPFLNGQEFNLEPSLPLGLSSYADYGETSLGLQLGDRLSFFTDGLLEARNEKGELYGFDRLHTLFATNPTAQQACEAAVHFGQDDDITVLTLIRLAAGEESTSHVVARNVEEAEAGV